MSRLDPTAMLRGCPLFTDLSPPLLTTIASLCRISFFQEGATLFHRGDAGDSLYGIHSGRVAIGLSTAAGINTTLAFLGPGDIFGEIALLDGRGRTADAVAAAPTELFTLRRADVYDLMSREPVVGAKFIDVLCSRLRSMTSQVEQGLTQSLKVRIAARLLQLARQSGHTLAITQEQLAHAVGASREGVNRQLRLFAAEGVLELRRGYIILKDIEAIKAM